MMSMSLIFTPKRLWQPIKPKILICKSFVQRWGVWFLLSILLITMCGCYYSSPDEKKRQTQPTPQSTTSTPEGALPTSVPSPTTDVQTIGARIQSALEDGDYEQVRDFLEQGRRAYQDKPEQEALYGELTNQLKVEMGFHCSLSRRHKSVGGLDAGITKNEPYWLTVKTFESCYLYILQRDSSGRFHSLFPSTDYSPLANPVESGVIRLPDSYGQLRLDDDIPGTETIYLIASRLRQKKRY